MGRFTLDELRLGVEALDIIEERGDREEWAVILRENRSVAPNRRRWGNATPNQLAKGRDLARKLASFLGEDVDRCDQAAAEVFAPDHDRATYDAIVGYAAELSGKSSRSTSKPAKRDTVRIVADSEVRA